VTPAESRALADVRAFASVGRIEVSPHAARRMRERNVIWEDVQCALAGAKCCRAEPSDRWRIDGLDTAGDELVAIVVLEDGVVVVTVF